MKDYLTKEIKKESNGIKLEIKKTNLKKEAFIQEIKNGLGEQIKLNRNKVEIIKPKKISFIKRFISKLYKMF
jgi:hypothetical protein